MTFNPFKTFNRLDPRPEAHAGVKRWGQKLPHDIFSYLTSDLVRPDQVTKVEREARDLVYHGRNGSPEK